MSYFKFVIYIVSYILQNVIPETEREPEIKVVKEKERVGIHWDLKSLESRSGSSALSRWISTGDEIWMLRETDFTGENEMGVGVRGTTKHTLWHRITETRQNSNLEPGLWMIDPVWWTGETRS